MPGTKEPQLSSNWFREAFGFEEEVLAWRQGEEKYLDAWGSDRAKLLFHATKSKFCMDGDTLVCTEGGEQRFHVGPFDVISLEELRSTQESESKVTDDEYWKCGGLTFKNIVASTSDLHRDPENAGAVFQVASLFNCLETSPPGAAPEEGVTVFAAEHTQGPACAISCPAATIFRMYFVNGDGQSSKSQVDCLNKVAELVGNEAEGYWRMRSGYCMPGTAGSIARLSTRLAEDQSLAAKVRDSMKVGVHWDTEVVGGSHRVCQVFCSAPPVGIAKSVRASDWAVFAQETLFAGFDATLTAAAILARRRAKRVRVYLTLVGGGALGNRRQWIADAIDKALGIHRAEPLDVELVHCAAIPHDGPCARLAKGRSANDLGLQSTLPGRSLSIARASSNGTRDAQIKRLKQEMEHMGEDLKKRDSIKLIAYPEHFSRFDLNGDGEIDRGEFAELTSWCESNVDAVALAFAAFDANGDGSIDRKEFSDILQVVSPTFFMPSTVDMLMAEADADGDGEIHYSEFLAWLYEEDPMIVSRMLSTSSLRQVV